MRLLAAKIALGPVLLVQGRRVRREALRLPEPRGARHGTHGARGGGAPPSRLLLVGDSAMAGVGADAQRDALAGQLGEPLLARLGPQAPRVAWRLVARTGIDTAGAIALLDEAWAAERDDLCADVAVVGVGVNDVTGQVPLQRWLRDVGTLVDRLRQRHGACVVILCGLPPVHLFPALPQPLRWYLGACARRHDRALRAWARGREGVRVHAFPPSRDPAMMAVDGFHPGPAGYRAWAASLAVPVAEAISRTTRRKDARIG